MVKAGIRVIAALVLAVALAATGQAQAATLASNLDTLLIYQSGWTYRAVDVSNDRFNEGGVALGQKFTTGSDSGGYTVTSVETCLVYVAGAAVPKVSIYSVDANGFPDTSLYTLTNPSTLVQAGYGDSFTSCADGKNTFTAPTNADLVKDTDYFIVFENVGTQATLDDEYSDYNIGWVLSGAEDLGADGWSLADTEHSKSTPTSSWQERVHSTSLARPLRVRINGTVGTGTDTTAPALAMTDAAVVNGTSLVLTYNEDLDEDSEPATSAYSVSVAGSARTVSSVDVDGTTVTLTLGTAVTFGQTVTVSYTVPMSNPVQDEAANAAVALTNQSVTNNSNTAPVFADDAVGRGVTESVGAATETTARAVGAVVTATDADTSAGDTLTYTLEGPTATFFTIDSTSGQIRLKVGRNYDFESLPIYASFMVKATDTKGGTDTITVTVSLGDEDEPPLAPAAPTVTATAGVTMTLNVTWTAPANTGRPAISSYDLQYKKTADSNWTNGPQAVTGTSANITGLDGNATYQVQVRASNAEGDGAWSLSGTGQTVNTPPAFTSASTTRSFAELEGDATVSTSADIGAEVSATDDDGDTLTYSLEGTDAAKFNINSGNGQIQTRVGESYDREAKASYVVTVKVVDDNGGSDTITVTISLTDVTEKAAIPVAPTVTSTSGSTTSLDVTWTAPANTGRPAITSYDLQYRKGTTGAWTNGPQDVTGTSTSITGLDGDSLYQVQMRATNADGDSDWSLPGSGRTANSPPTFSGPSTTRSLAETLADAIEASPRDVGAMVTATDPDGTTLTYTLEGTDAAKFNINSGNGQIQTRAGESYDFETQTSYEVTVKATDTSGASGVITVTINLTNVTGETPEVPSAPSVSTTTGVTMTLDVTWTAPANTGRPAITSYDLQYKKTADSNWTNGPQAVTGTSANILGLDGNTTYQVRIRATNADGDSDWSSPGNGVTENTPPVFTDESTTRSFTETVRDATVQSATDIGAAVTAEDADNDTLTYSLEGTDAAKFEINSGTGQIQTRVGESYDREAKQSYVVTVKADDSNGGSDTIAVTINVTNVTEFESAQVQGSGVIFIRFIEVLSSTLPSPSALTVTLDGEPVAVESIEVKNQKQVSLSLIENLRIRAGQTVLVSYTDPTPENDNQAIQDNAGNDAASFTDEPVVNASSLQPRRPEPPTGVTAVLDPVNPTVQINLSWTAPVDNGGRPITAYRIERSPDGVQSGRTDWTELSTTTTTSYIHTVAAGTTHYYRVLAINSVGTGNPSATTENSTATTPLNAGAPTQPMNLNVRYEKTQAHLSWDPPVDEGDAPVTNYRIENSEDNGANWETVANIPVQNPGTAGQVQSVGLGQGVIGQVKTTYTMGTTYQYTHTGLNPGVSYLYQVFAMNGDGPGDVSAPAESPRGPLASTVCVECANAPTNLRAKLLSDGQVVLEWAAPTEGLPATFYEWWWSNGNAVIEWSSTSSSRTTFYVPPPYDEFPPGQEVRFKVRARNDQDACENNVDPEDLIPLSDPGSLTCPAGYTLHRLRGGVGVETEPIVVTLESLQRTLRRPLVSIPLADQTAFVGVPFTYSIPEDSFTNADGDPLTYVAATRNDGALPLWLEFDVTTQTFTGTPESSDGGTVFVTVTASDGTGTATDEFLLTVVVADRAVLSAWLSRFGRTVGTHVADAVADRLRGRRDSHVSVGGRRLALGQDGMLFAPPSQDVDRPPGLTDEMGLKDTRSGLDSLPNSGKGIGSGLQFGGESLDPWIDQTETQELDLRQLLTGTSFQMALNPEDAGTSSRLTAWGRAASTQFDGHEGEVAVDGDVLTATLGVDTVQGQWLTGLAVSHSRGEGGYSLDKAELQGDLDNDLTSLHPYLRYAVHDGLDVWGVLGYGWGELSIKPDVGDILRVDTNLSMAVFGARGVLLAASEQDDLELTTRTDLMFTQMSSEKIAELPSSNAYAHRLRAILEGSRSFTWEEGHRLTPAVELGLRNDWGSAESGFGMEVGTRVGYADPASRLTMEVAARGLLVHEADHYREWGASGTARLEPRASGRGLSFALTSSWGAVASEVEGMWTRETITGLVPQDDNHAPNGRMEVQLGYGLWVPALEGLVTPFTRAAFSDSGEARSRSGLLFYRRNTRAGPVRAELAGERIESDTGELEHTFGLQVRLQLGHSNSPFRVESDRPRRRKR